MRADTITKNFMRDERIFADVFNQYLYGGEQVIQPEQLKQQDPAEIALPYGEEGAAVPVQKIRDEIMKYQTDLREVMLFIKYSKDHKKLLEIMEKNRIRYEKLERRAADVIEAVTGSGLKYEKEKETVNMCEAIQELKREAYDQGEKEGRQEGIMSSVRILMEKTGLTIDAAVDFFNIPAEEREQLKTRL